MVQALWGFLSVTEEEKKDLNRRTIRQGLLVDLLSLCSISISLSIPFEFTPVLTVQFREETSFVTSCISAREIERDSSAYRVKLGDVVEETHPVAVVLPRNPSNGEAEIFYFRKFSVALQGGEKDYSFLVQELHCF